MSHKYNFPVMQDIIHAMNGCHTDLVLMPMLSKRNSILVKHVSLSHNGTYCHFRNLQCNCRVQSVAALVQMSKCS